MWRLNPLETEKSAQELQVVADRLHLPFNGIPNYLKHLARSTASMKAYVETEDALGKGLLTPQQRESIALVVAAINGSDYCLAAHGIAARLAGLSQDEIAATQNASASDPKTETLLRFVQAIVLQRGELGDPDFAAMQKAGYSESEIIEVLANVVLNIFTNYFNLLVQTNPDNQFLHPEPNDYSANKLVLENSL